MKSSGCKFHLQPAFCRLAREKERFIEGGSLSIRRFWGKGEKGKRKRKRGEGKIFIPGKNLREPSRAFLNSSLRLCL